MSGGHGNTASGGRVDARSFQHLAPPSRVFKGPNSLASLGRELDRVNSKRAVIFCGSSLSREGQLLNLLKDAIGPRCAGIFDGVRAHSPVPEVEAAARTLRQLEADAVIAVGGGSAIVTARAACILLAESRGVRELCTVRTPTGELRSPKLLAAKMPQFVVPTTPTTAIVKAGSALFDPRTRERLALFDPKTRASAVFLHPAALVTAPRELLLSASLNTFAMAIEGLTSTAGDPFADAQLMHALRLLARHLQSPSSPDEQDFRADLVIAAMLCGHGTDHTGAGITTVLGHAIGARHDVENGLVNGIVLPHAIRFNGEASKPGLFNVADALGRDSWSAALVDVVAEFLEDLLTRNGTPQRLRDIGVAREALPELAANAMSDWFLRGNPRPVRDASELERFLQDIW